ncbi:MULTISPECIES: DUF6088 family protein [Stutzerimonas]|jgi:hypothetical protein|uniref:Type IV toxin-antitoxin system AbiEi family antitoxin domain-containing protein n=1 Tax=Stutzerimonas stutzeri TaxID=316 RepID=A0AA42PGF5_STUST|nr:MULTISPECIES: DUF6088 family protein [Stutzerimonas]MDH1238624.1 type IV toxin-antitoxin system AbiEi family antitoxin domain-containing protein [Stutzerimonas stutzeri]
MIRADRVLSVTARVAQRVKLTPKGQPFSIRRFAEFGTRSAVSKAINRLVNRGELERVYRGIYMRPKPGQYTAWVRPNVWQVTNLIASQNHQVLQLHGADAVRLFGLSTQMPLIPIYYTSGPSRSIFIGKAEIRLVHAPPMVMQHCGTEVGTAISALFYLGKDNSTPECIVTIKKALRPEDLAKLMTSKMPKWMRVALEA